MLISNIIERVINRICPLKYGCKSWDNIGLIIPKSDDIYKENEIIIMIVNDISTTSVLEAIKKNVSFIISYHPPIFSPLKNLNHLEIPYAHKEEILLCIKHNIGIYTVHSALDNAPKGINWWLAQKLAKNVAKPHKIKKESNKAKAFDEDSYYYVEFLNLIPLDEILKKLKKELGFFYYKLASVDPVKSNFTLIKKVAIFPGSAASLIIKKEFQYDLVIFGECSYHNIIEFTKRGTNVVILEHTITETPYLKNYFLKKLIKNFNSIAKKLNLPSKISVFISKFPDQKISYIQC